MSTCYPHGRLNYCRPLACGVLLALVGCSAVNAQPVGRTAFSGRVIEQQGRRPLPGLLVVLHRENIDRRDTEPGRFSVITGADGTFQFTGLPAASYIVCATGLPDDEYVDYCAWTFWPPRVTLAAGPGTTGYEIRMEKGVRIDVEVTDPDRLLERIGSVRRKNQMQVSVASREVPPNQMHFSKMDHQKMEFFLVVPRRQGLRVVARADEADLSKPNEPPGLAKRTASEDVDLPPGLAKKTVEWRLHRKR